MYRLRRGLALSLVVSTALTYILVAASGTSVASADDPVVEVSDGVFVVSDVNLDGEIAASEANTGDTITNGIVTLTVPEPGQSVSISMEGTVTDIDMEVATTLEGEVQFESTYDPSDPEGRSGANECQDDAYNILTVPSGAEKHFLPGANFHWRFNRGSTPNLPGLTADAVVADYQKATKQWVNGVTLCNVTANINLNQTYDGTTSKHDDLNNAGNGCAAMPDTISVVDFDGIDQPLGGGQTLAVTCTFANLSTGRILEVDTRMNSGTAWFTGSTVPASCTGSFSFLGVATHERGHAFGLAHVTEANHANLTMSKYNDGPCQLEESTLGWGDIQGMKHLY